MPELPEVETIRRGLAPHVEGRTFTSVAVHDERWCRPRPPAEMEALLGGRRVRALRRRGKYLEWVLDDEVFLFVHLRMTGTLLYEPADRPVHTRVTFGLDDGSTLLYVDPRRFGTGEIALGEDERDAFFAARLGVEPFDDEFTTTHLLGLTRRSRAPIKSLVLDQTKIAGVGNIYADEALFRARLHPLRPAYRTTRAQAEALREGIVAALQAGIDAKGASIDDFRDPYGVQGSFQDQFLVHLREGEPCPRCGTLVRKLRAAGRGTYVCERCQPRPRASRKAGAVATTATRRRSVP